MLFASCALGGRGSPEPRQDDGLVLLLADLADDVEDGLQDGRQHLLGQHLLPQTRPHVLEPQLLQERGGDLGIRIYLFGY